MVLQPPRPALLEPNRRAALATTLAALCAVRPWPALAESGEITDRIRLEFAQQLNAEEKQYFRLTLGLFGKDAPVATAQFKALCAGTLAVPCEPELRRDEEVLFSESQSRFLLEVAPDKVADVEANLRSPQTTTRPPPPPRP